MFCIDGRVKGKKDNVLCTWLLVVIEHTIYARKARLESVERFLLQICHHDLRGKFACSSKPLKHYFGDSTTTDESECVTLHCLTLL